MMEEHNNTMDVSGLTVVRDRVPVLCEVHLAVRRGETLAVMGPNGAGKSTLLKCLAGLMRPSRGDIRWFGTFTGPVADVRRKIGFVGHECGLYRELTALENLTFAGRMYGVDHPGERARNLLRDGGLEWTADRQVARLSQGVCRRLAIARALVHEPKLILLDEPFASLDENGRHRLERLFQQWRHEGRTVCFAGHDIGQCTLLADRTVRLDRGHVEECDVFDRCPVATRRSA